MKLLIFLFNMSISGKFLATLDSSSPCCLHITTCQTVMIAVCKISFFSSLQAQVLELMRNVLSDKLKSNVNSVK